MKNWGSFIGGASSDDRRLSIGMPQCSILGPILFLIYINDLLDSSTGAGFTIFADDTFISYTVDTLLESRKC